MGKGEERVLEALQMMSERLPFKLLAIDSDNGSEFLNWHLIKHCDAEQIHFARSRPYKKDDNAHIEQKNWTMCASSSAGIATIHPRRFGR
jgi:IS30 family transposase